MKIQVRCLIDNLRAFEKKERRLRVCRVVGVGEAVPDQHRADSLNTGWVKVPVKFPALAVVASGRFPARVTVLRNQNGVEPTGFEPAKH